MKCGGALPYCILTSLLRVSLYQDQTLVGGGSPWDWRGLLSGSLVLGVDRSIGKFFVLFLFQYFYIRLHEFSLSSSMNFIDPFRPKMALKKDGLGGRTVSARGRKPRLYSKSCVKNITIRWLDDDWLIGWWLDDWMIGWGLGDVMMIR